MRIGWLDGSYVGWLYLSWMWRLYLSWMLWLWICIVGEEYQVKLILNIFISIPKILVII